MPVPMEACAHHAADKATLSVVVFNAVPCLNQLAARHHAARTQDLATGYPIRYDLRPECLDRRVLCDRTFICVGAPHFDAADCSS